MPGERLMEISLANELGVSRTPIREAIRKLEHEGLVAMIPRRGAHVTEITRQELEDVLEIRKSLDVLAIRKAMLFMTPEDFEKLHAAEDSFARLIEDKETDLTTLGEADERFHDIIYKGTRNRRLIQILSNLREQIYRFRVEYLKDLQIRKILVREHDAIIGALERRDEKEAVRLMKLHVDNQFRTINRALDLKGEETARSDGA